MTQSRRALLLFTRTPEAEARAKGLAPDGASPLFSAFLASWKVAAEAAGARLVISSPPRCAERFREGRLCEGALVLTQSDQRFGERVASAVDEVFALGFSSVSVVAGDAPAVTGKELGLVFAALERRRAAVVVGPSRDGGVYLVGLANRGSGFLAGLSLRNPRLCAELESELRRAGRPVVRLEVRGELDELADLQRARLSSRTSPVWQQYGALLAEALQPDFRTPSNSDLTPGFPPSAAIPARAPPAA